MNDPHLTCVGMSRVRDSIYVWITLHMDASRQVTPHVNTCEWVMSNTWMTHISHVWASPRFVTVFMSTPFDTWIRRNTTYPTSTCHVTGSWQEFMSDPCHTFYKSVTTIHIWLISQVRDKHPCHHLCTLQLISDFTNHISLYKSYL